MAELIRRLTRLLLLTVLAILVSTFEAVTKAVSLGNCSAALLAFTANNGTANFSLALMLLSRGFVLIAGRFSEF